jgi:hypothetical protein
MDSIGSTTPGGVVEIPKIIMKGLLYSAGAE